MTDIFD